MADSWARSIKTRIETPGHPGKRNRKRSIREQDPLKQGLKPLSFFSTLLNWFNSWARSIKTRIETSWNLGYRQLYRVDSWARSIKTRIETSNGNDYHITCFWNSWARSIKTRIETNYVEAEQCVSMIREQDPLKQGLKPIIWLIMAMPSCYSWARSIKTRIETWWKRFGSKFLYYSWARSIKTRIETQNLLI